MFKENNDFNNLKIASFDRAIFFISKGVIGEIFKSIPRLCEGGVGSKGGK